MNFEELVFEWVKTFSNKSSFLSSKRIERFTIFGVMLSLTIVFIVNSIIKCTLTAVDFTIVISVWLGLAGFNVIQGRKDVKSESNTGEEENA